MTTACDAIQAGCGGVIGAAVATDTCRLARIDQAVAANLSSNLAATDGAAGHFRSVGSDRSGVRLKRHEHGLR